MEKILAIHPKGFIVSAGPRSAYEPDAPYVQDFIFKTGLPILGICYGMQAMTHALGGEVIRPPAANMVRLKLKS